MNANAFEALLSAYIDSNQILGRKREYLWYTCGLHLIHICARYKLAKKTSNGQFDPTKEFTISCNLSGYQKILPETSINSHFQHRSTQIL